MTEITAYRCDHCGDVGNDPVMFHRLVWRFRRSPQEDALLVANNENHLCSKCQIEFREFLGSPEQPTTEEGK